MVLQAGRYHEEVEAYEVAYVVEERLLLGYAVRLGDRHGSARGSEYREVALALDDLRAQPEIAVECFPVERISIAEEFVPDGVALPVVDSAEPARSGSRLVVDADAGLPSGFRLLQGDRELGRFHSGALYRVHHEWWVIPLLPLTAAVDLVSLVPQLIVAPPLFVMGE